MNNVLYFTAADVNGNHKRNHNRSYIYSNYHIRCPYVQDL